MIYIIYSFLTIILIIITYKNYFMSNQVVTIGYLKDFVSGKLTVNTNKPDTYCPTYAELTGGSLVKNYSAGANPKDTVNGIDIPNCTVNIGYENNQLVIRQDLLLKYMVLDSIAITADSTSISQCGGQTNVCVKGTFHLETKSEGGSVEKGGSETDSTIKATWSGDADNSGPSTCTVISFGENTVGGYGTSNPTTAPSRNESTTATYTYKGTNLTSVNDTTKTSNTVTITQAANNVHDWYYEGKTDYATSLVASCPGNVSENGGTATVTSTLYYEQDWRCDDDCGNTVGYKYVSTSKSGPSTSVTFAEQDCDEPERCETASLSMSGQSTSCSVCQDESSVPCYCGENCAGNCNTTIHWHCAEKKSYTNMGTTYTINGLDGDGCLPCSGGTATVIIHGTTDTELYTRAAECKTATLSTTMGKTADQTVVGLVQSHTGETGSGTYYDYLYGRSYTVPTNKYTAYTQYHYMAYNTAGKHNRNETTYQYDTLGTSYKYEVLEYSFNDYYISSKKFYSKSDFVNAGNSAATWDAAMERYNNSATCSGGTGDDCSGGTWVYDEDLNPNETGITGNYKVWFTNYTNFSKMDDEMMDRVPNVCYVASISPDKTMFYSASTSNNSMIKTFEFAANTTTAATNGSVTFTSDNPSVGNSPNKIEKITVNYKVAACTNDTDKYTISSVTAPSTAVACSAIPGNGVNITVSGAHSIVKVSQADPKVSGETTASAYTMTQGTDYTMNYTPTGSNTGIEDRTVTVTITGIGKFSGQTKTVTYTQKADTACTTATTCTPSTSYTYSSYSVSYNGGAVNCNAEPSKSKITVTANKTTTTKDVFCQESSTTENGVSITDFSVSYSPSGNNTGTSNRTVTGTVTHNGSTAGTFTFTQNSGSTCQATVTSTTYTYRIDAADFDACDSETTVTVYATPTYHYSDGSTITGEETEISVFPLPTITYRLGTGETTVTASENSTSSSRIWTVLASFKHNNSTHTASDTATQSAGPCNTGSTVYEYTFKNCYSDRQIGLFASNATPSGSHLQFAMLSAFDGTAVTVLVNSNTGTLVNGSTSNSSSYAKIGDSVKVYSVTNTTNIWTLEETITLTASNRSFEYGCVDICSSVKVSCSPSQVTSGGSGFTNNGAKTTITVTGGTTNKWSVISTPDDDNTTSNNNSGAIYIGYKFGTYKIQSDECPEKTCTFKILEPEIKGIRIANNQPGTAKIYKTTQNTGKVLLGTLSNRGQEQVFNVTFDDHGSLDIEYDTNQWRNDSSCFVYVRVEGDNLMQIGSPTQNGVTISGGVEGATITANMNGSCSGSFATASGYYTIMINIKYAGYPCTGC